MRKGKLYISIILGLCLCLFTAFGVACKDESSTGNSSTGGDSSTEEPATPTLESISVSGATEVFIDEFDYADYTITATYSDDSTKTATLTADNLSAEDNAKFSTVGTHALTVRYESVTCSWTVTLKNHDFTGLTFEDITTTYDGTAKTLAVAGLPTGAQVSYDKATSYTNAGEYTVKATVTLANYNPVELTATLTINKATYDMSAVVFADKTVTYNGESHSIEATNLPNGVTAQYTGNNQVNANEYTITATFTGDSQNYEPIANKTATLTINKATYDMSGVVFKDKSVNYTGEAYSIEATNLPSGVSATYDGNNQTQAGEYTVTAHFTGDSVNYNAIPNMTAKLKINASDLTGISFHDGEFTYDGTEKSIFITGELPEGVEVEYTNNEQINADSYTVTAKFTCTNGNYTNLPELTATLTIKKAVYDMSAVVFADKTVTYNGESHSITATNLPNGVTAQYTGNNQINAGEYTITATFTGDSQNYELIASKTTTLTIEQRELTLAFKGETTLKYNGSAQKTVSVQATNLVNGDSVELTISYNGEMIEAGEYIATATLTAHQNYKLTANNTVKVIITRATHTVTFKQDGFADVTREVLDLADLTDIPTPQHVDGYKFTWNRTDFTSITEDITVTANKTLITYTIEYVLTYGTNPSDNPTTYTIETASITLKNPANLFGMQFGGWYTSETFLPSTCVTKIGGGTFGDLTLYGQFVGYRVEEATGFEIDYSQGTPTISKTVSYATAEMDLRDCIAISTGCTWQVSGDELGTVIYSRKIIPLTTGNNVFYLSVFHPDGNHDTLYELHIYRLDMKSYAFMDGLTEYETGEIEELSPLNAPENPTCGGYMFDGWQINGEGALVQFPYVVTDDIVFVAKYTPIVYTATFYPNGGTLDEDKQSYTIETGMSFETPARDYYDFAGWYEVGTDKPFDGIAVGIYGNKEFYAKWNPTVYTIAYELHGGVWTENNQNPATYTIETADIVFDDTVERAGYSFVAWCWDEELEKQTTGIACGSHGDKTVYAKWTPNLNTLKFDGNGATSGEMSEMKLYTGETKNLNKNQFERKGYLFMGWSTTENGGVGYSNGVSYTMGTDGEYTLYAVWNIIFTVNGNTITGLASAGKTLTKLAIPDTIDGVAMTAIGTDAFKGNQRITYVEISNGIATIGTQAFHSCSNLSEVNLSNTIISIGSYSFAYCNNLLEIKLPNSLITIADSAFRSCSSLKEILIPENVTTVGTNAFASTGIQKATCSIEFVDYIPTTLQTLIITDGTTISGYEFEAYKYLQNITIPSSMITMEQNAFSGCRGLENVYISSIEDWCKISFGSANANPLYYAKNLYVNNELLTELVIPDNVVSIGNYTFYGYSRLTGVIIGESVSSIGSSAFYDCSSLTSVVIGDGVTSIGNYVFSGCDGLIIYCESEDEPSGWSSSWNNDGHPVVWNCDNNDVADDGYIYMLFENVSYGIKDGATKVVRQQGNITTAHISETVVYKDVEYSVTSIGDSAFYGCTGLTRVVIPDSVTSIGDSAFYGCTGLTSVVIGDGVTSIGDYAFTYCSSLTSVVIGDGVTSIENSAFAGCSSLTSVVIPDSVTSIGWEAFAYCNRLTSVVIGDGVTSIGYWVFRDCSNLTSVYYNGTSEEWSAISIGSYNTELTSATRYYYSETAPVLNADGTAYDGNYWHYDESGEVVVWVYTKPEE